MILYLLRFIDLLAGPRSELLNAGPLLSKTGMIKFNLP